MLFFYYGILKTKAPNKMSSGDYLNVKVRNNAGGFLKAIIYKDCYF
jgi:hypothetical protein